MRTLPLLGSLAVGALIWLAPPPAGVTPQAWHLLGIFVAADLVLAPAIPSNTARSAGLVFPVVAALATTLGSRPTDGTARQVGAFLIVTAYQGAMITSAMFLTGTTGNLVTMRLAAEQGVVISWATWRWPPRSPAR